MSARAGLIDLKRAVPMGTALSPLLWVVERLLGLDQLNRFYVALGEGHADAQDFCLEALRRLGVDWHVGSIGLQSLKEVEGPCLVVANHPLGGRDALLMHGVLAAARRDYRILANQLVGALPQTRSKLILVDPFGGPKAAAVNRRAMREAWVYLQKGGLLGVFPAGEVSYWQDREGRVADKPWASQVARLALGTEATVVPLFFTGASSPLLQRLAAIHPALKTPLLPREMLNGPARNIEARLGAPVAPWRLLAHKDPATLAAWLRQEVYALESQAPLV